MFQSVIRPEVKEMFKYAVDRSSASSKLHDLSAWTKSIVEDVTYQRVVSSYWIGKMYIRGWYFFNVIAILLSLVIAVVILVSWKESANKFE